MSFDVKDKDSAHLFTDLYTSIDTMAMEAVYPDKRSLFVFALFFPPYHWVLYSTFPQHTNMYKPDKLYYTL